MKRLRLLMLPFLLCTLFILVSATKEESKETEKIHNAVNVLKDFGKMKERIPHELIENYQGIIVIPRLFNAGFAIGGKFGKGIAMVKLDNGKWSDPVFVNLTGGSFGFQFGVRSVDVVLVFRHKGVLEKVEHGDFKIGGDVSATAGPVGTNSTTVTDYNRQTEVYSYSRGRGLFAGISISGSDLSVNKKANTEYYGPDKSSEDIFETSKSNTEAVKILKETLRGL
ncbi:MAG TPA: lipid-binding SYLF domain-containing protein [Mucilaginibacter sp.]|jgi:lipid-binding SYLF domain-containing protein|nr:lipid-binding SYLF domain-containing protein [Mucilaginibacter sp.]